MLVVVGGENSNVQLQNGIIQHIFTEEVHD